MNKKNLFLIFFSLFCFSIIALLLISIEWEEVEQEVGLTKKASVDPLLAARLFLEQKNILTTPIISVEDVEDVEKIEQLNNADTNEIKVIRLDNGGLRITTRKDEPPPENKQ